MSNAQERQVAVKLPEDLHRALKMKAALDGRSMRELIILAIGLYLRQAEHEHLRSEEKEFL